jgi:branched-chain amino acid transport system substrate-binding protein
MGQAKMSKTTKTILWLVILIIIVVGIWYGLSKKTTTPTTKEPIKIGAILPLTGKYAYIGEAEKNGLNMAIEEINSKGGINGRRLVLVIEDNQGDAKQAVSGISKLLNIDNVDVIFSAFTHITNAIKDMIAQKGKIMIYAATVRNIAESNPLFFRDYYDAVDHGRVLAKLVKNSGYKNIAFLTEISDQCQELENAFKEEAARYGINIVTKESFNTTETDLKTPLLKIKESKAETIVCCTWRHEHILMKQLKEFEMINIQTFHWVAPFLPVSDTKEMRDLFEENKAISTWYGFAKGSLNEKQREFFIKYQRRYGIEPTADAVYAYDDIYALADALMKCDQENRIKDPNCISAKLKNVDYNGVAGRLTFSDLGVSNREVIVIKVESGEWVKVPIE